MDDKRLVVPEPNIVPVEHEIVVPEIVRGV